MPGVNEGTPEEKEQQTPAPVPGSPEYDAAMAEKYQNANGQQPPADDPKPEENPADPSLTIQKPDDGESLILGKFKTEEEALAYIAELEGKATPKEEAAAPEGQPEGQTEGTPPELTPLFEKAASEFDAGGEITAETVESLVKAGIPQQFIDTYIAGVKAESARLMTEAQGLVGGEDNWNAMMKWAQSLPSAEIDAFNKAVLDPATSGLAIQGLFAKYTAANGDERPSITANADHAAVGGDTYKSKAEMTADMRDPRYATDAAFRETVAQKIARSRKAGTIGALGVAY